MRILDKNTDYYDYLQNVNIDDTFTFDRRSSFDLTKADICCQLKPYFRSFLDTTPGSHLLLLQVCNTFWLIVLQGKNKQDNIYTDYDILTVESWKDYTKERKLLCLQVISINTFNYFSKKRSESLDQFVKDRCQRIRTNDYNVEYTFDCADVTKPKPQYPRLQKLGIPAYIPAPDIYYSIEEYFSAEKTASEKDSSEPITDVEKAINHGFDKKSSFRNIKK